MFGWELPPENSGGLGVACLGLTKELCGRGVDLTFVVPRKTKAMEKNFMNLLAAGVRYKEIEFESPLTPYVDSKSYKSILKEEENNIYGKNLFEEVSRYRKCAKKIALHEKFDIIHAHDWLSFGAGIEAKKITGKPLVAHVHATEYDRGGGKNVDPRVYKREKEGMEMADKIIAVSNYTKRIIVNEYSIPEEKVEVAHNGVDLKEKPVGEKMLEEIKEAGKKIVLFVGRLTLQKGPDYFLRAAKKVSEYKDDVLFIIAGSGDMERQVMDEAGRLQISDKVIFPGFIRGEKLHGLYKAADLFIMPSVSEPFGLTPLESLINGTPVILSKQSGVSEVVSHALKVDFWDTDEMANQILTSLENDSMIKCLAKNGKKEVKKITWEAAADKCLQVYQNLIKIN
jgi:glycosyltransferase involved in cell wall biosynthesis